MSMSSIPPKSGHALPWNYEVLHALFRERCHLTILCQQTTHIHKPTIRTNKQATPKETNEHVNMHTHTRTRTQNHNKIIPSTTTEASATTRPIAPTPHAIDWATDDKTLLLRRPCLQHRAWIGSFLRPCQTNSQQRSLTMHVSPC